MVAGLAGPGGGFESSIPISDPIFHKHSSIWS
jgi:hypothetical protein